jgi:alanine-glyoxylate transaminase/(R)-3-amino-2-methylpropionate-pyruvate transaminase
VRRAGGVCIADEVQTGFGRTGYHYWGFANQGVVPDIVTLAKGIGNGAPLAAVVTTPEIAAALTRRHHFNTFGGNPVSCAVGRAVLEVIDREGLQQNALELGAVFRNGLRELMSGHALIGDVRGLGLMLGIELVKDRMTKEPAKEECKRVMERAKDLGLLVGRGGYYGNVIRIKPPLCITRADVDFALAVLDMALSEV